SNEECYFIKRLRKQDGKPFVLEESYYRKSIIPFMSKEIAEGSIFDYIREGLKKEIRFSDKYMRVRKLTADEAKYLELKEGDPCLEVYDTFYLANGTAFDSSKLVYNYKNSKFYDQSSDDII
ncbi:UTRA domain-containing protein, partial [Lactobacillus gasseri]|nr:UTRA domain-containing protein [Lactobacillus gasseri]